MRKHLKHVKATFPVQSVLLVWNSLVRFGPGLRRIMLAVGLMTWLLRTPSVEGQSNALDNSGFEEGLNSWMTDHATLRSIDPPPHGGAAYLFGADDGSPISYTFQIVTIEQLGFGAKRVDDGGAAVRYGGWQSGWHTQQDSGKIELQFRDSHNGLISTVDLGWHFSNNEWIEHAGAAVLPAGTRSVSFGFYALRKEGHNTDGYLDDAYLLPEPAECGKRAHLLATCKKGGRIVMGRLKKAAPGTPVTFTLDGGTPIERVTNPKGVAKVTYSDQVAGPHTVEACSLKANC